MLLHFHNLSCGYNQRCNLYQEPVPLLQSIFTSLTHPYLFKNSSFQCPLTLPSYITQQLFTSLFLRTIIPTICTKKFFPTSNIFPIQTASSDQAVTEYCEKWHCFNLFLLPRTMDSDSSGHSQSLILYRSESKKMMYYKCGKPSNPLSLIPSTYFHYFHIQLVPPRELTLPWNAKTQRKCLAVVHQR